jgi:hypothetical protein
VKRRSRALAAISASLALVLLFTPALTRAAGGDAVATLLFSISKTENRNYVQYAERLDTSCAPVGPAPVYAFWRMLERGPSAVEPLLPHEQPAYGIGSQSVLSRGDGRSSVRVTLRGLPRTPLLVESWRASNGACEASARTSISGVDARLFNVHAVLKWPFGIDHLLVSGWSLADGRPVKDSRAP